jgi:hypothetical protein
LGEEVSDFFNRPVIDTVRSLRTMACVPIQTISCNKARFVKPETAVLRQLSAQSKPYMDRCAAVLDQLGLSLVDPGVFISAKHAKVLGVRPFGGDLVVQILKLQADKWNGSADTMDDSDHEWLAWLLERVADEPQRSDYCAHVKRLRQIAFVPMSDGSLRRLSPKTPAFELIMDSELIEQMLYDDDGDAVPVVSSKFLNHIRQRVESIKLIKAMGLQRSDGPNFIFEHLLPQLTCVQDPSKAVKLLCFIKTAVHRLSKSRGGALMVELAERMRQLGSKVVLQRPNEGSGGASSMFPTCPLSTVHFWSKYGGDTGDHRFLPYGWGERGDVRSSRHAGCWHRVSDEYLEGSIDGDADSWIALFQKLGVQPMFAVTQQVRTLKVAVKVLNANESSVGGAEAGETEESDKRQLRIRVYAGDTDGVTREDRLVMDTKVKIGL